jgi:hypothetical protein
MAVNALLSLGNLEVLIGINRKLTTSIEVNIIVNELLSSQVVSLFYANVCQVGED